MQQHLYEGLVGQTSLCRELACALQVRQGQANSDVLRPLRSGNEMLRGRFLRSSFPHRRNQIVLHLLLVVVPPARFLLLAGKLWDFHFAVAGRHISTNPFVSNTPSLLSSPRRTPSPLGPTHLALSKQW